MNKSWTSHEQNWSSSVHFLLTDSKAISAGVGAELGNKKCMCLISQYFNGNDNDESYYILSCTHTYPFMIHFRVITWLIDIDQVNEEQIY